MSLPRAFVTRLGGLASYGGRSRSVIRRTERYFSIAAIQNQRSQSEIARRYMSAVSKPATGSVSEQAAKSVSDVNASLVEDMEMNTQITSRSAFEKLIEPLHPNIKTWAVKWYDEVKPDNVRICDGSEAEASALQQVMVDAGQLEKLTDPKYENCWSCCTDPADVARVESKTVIATADRRTTIPTTKDGVQGKLGMWMSPDDLEVALGERTPKCMEGRTMYIIPFSMGPVGGPLSKCGVQITDSPYVVLSQHVMARVDKEVFNVIERDNGAFVKCFHSVGCPIVNGKTDRQLTNNWPCNPEKVLVSHYPDREEIISYGSGYGGNSLLGKKCFALRIGSTIAKKEGWLAEHMLISGITSPEGEKKYIAAAFPSACGKTNLAMMEPLVPGWKFECVGDDIAWLKFNEEDGRLYAINPENGFFGVAPGTSMETNPNAMVCCYKNTVFTNVAKTVDSDGNTGIWWEGMPKPDPSTQIFTWKGQLWDGTGKAAHPNSRFCTPAGNCPVISDKWEDPQGVPIDSIIFGGRRPEGVPLVYECYSWEHGVMVGAAMRSEATAAAEHKGKAIMNDPFAMRPFFGYNFGHYLQHWLDVNKPGRKMPKVFHVNWFRKSAEGGFLWPGFGENVRVLEWIMRRSGANQITDNATDSAIGIVPNHINTEGLKEQPDMKALFAQSKEYHQEEIVAFKKYLDEQVGDDVPAEVHNQISEFQARVDKM